MSKATVFIGQGSRDWSHNLDDLLERWRERKTPDSSGSIEIDEQIYGDEQNYGDFLNYIRSLEYQNLTTLFEELVVCRKIAIEAMPKEKSKSKDDKTKKHMAFQDAKRINDLMETIWIEKTLRDRKKQS